ncbi:MAG: hypothetical protein RIT43_447 [Bacteroidota bacterium]
MKLLSTLAFIVLFCLSLSGQTTIWQENFENSCSLLCLGNAYSGPNGNWTETITGSQGTNPNKWYVSCAESNTGLGTCSGDCVTTANETLHIGMDLGISPCATGDCGATYHLGPCAPICSASNARIESPTINLAGASNLILSFSYIEGGNGSSDNATLVYFDGSSWSTLADPPSTSNGTCGAGSGTWTTYSVALPSSANNNPNVKIGFLWINNDDNLGGTVSFAVDEIRITLIPPNASFTASSTSICENNCVTFTNTSTFGSGASFSWDFGNGQTSNAQNPGSVCYTSAGTFNVTLTVTDDNGTDTQISTSYITVTAGPNAGADNATTICNNGPYNLNGLLAGADPGGTWEESTAVPSGQLNTSNGFFDATCVPVGTYTFDYIVSNGTCRDTAQMTVTTIACGGPTAGISTPTLNVCVGQPLVFSDNSCGTNIDSWLWSFGGGSPGTANTQGPHSITWNTAGVYNVLLVVTDDNGTDSETIQITVSSCGAPIAAFNLLKDTICNENCVSIINNSSSSGATTYAWVFEGGTPATSSQLNPGQICYDTLSPTGDPVTLPIVLTVTNSISFSTFTQYITVVPPPTISVSVYTPICCPNLVEMGGLVQMEAVASSGTISWNWVPDGQGNIADCITPSCDTINAYPIIDTDFIVTTTTEYGCSTDTIVTVFVNYDAAIGVPNTFSPNQNDINDVLRVRGLGITEMNFRIYNRYGQKVFESTDPLEGWNGMFNGKPEQSGTFLYMLDYTLINGNSGFLSGNITLIR